MLLLFETAAGYSLFKVRDTAQLESVENILQEFVKELYQPKIN